MNGIFNAEIFNHRIFNVGRVGGIGGYSGKRPPYWWEGEREEKRKKADPVLPFVPPEVAQPKGVPFVADQTLEMETTNLLIEAQEVRDSAERIIVRRRKRRKLALIAASLLDDT